ncbi:serine/arginine repetitive matrix protein 1-like [Ctenocephalides felis]|uniref:serine/arginine repetitive matrix protein 1-like n=1 Tax=Ctenocephalides felis TaxID=7515 RepID=UPI000E6E4DE8|nr:serine/arginine repetitive matrix protein 1-like [Ctenocephalides felis]
MMYTGTTTQQDTRFSDKEKKKLMKQMKFGDCLSQRVDMSKVKLDVLRPWITQKITDLLHIEDDVVVEFVYNQLDVQFPCPKKMQINMTGFLNEKNARQFMDELWALLLSAQDTESGIPVEFLDQKKEEIKKRMRRTPTDERRDSTESEKEFRRKYQSVKHRLVHRRSCMEMYKKPRDGQFAYINFQSK